MAKVESIARVALMRSVASDVEGVFFFGKDVLENHPRDAHILETHINKIIFTRVD